MQQAPTFSCGCDATVLHTKGPYKDLLINSYVGNKTRAASCMTSWLMGQRKDGKTTAYEAQSNKALKRCDATVFECESCESVNDRRMQAVFCERPVRLRPSPTSRHDAACVRKAKEMSKLSCSSLTLVALRSRPREEEPIQAVGIARCQGSHCGRGDDHHIAIANSLCCVCWACVRGSFSVSWLSCKGNNVEQKIQ